MIILLLLAADVVQSAFTETTVEFITAEDAPLGTIFELSELTRTKNVTHRLARPSRYFDFNPKNYSLVLKSSLDREKDEREELVILSSVPSITHISFRITDVNDNPPLFPSPIQKVTIVETSVAGSRISLLPAFDPDAGASGTIAGYELLASDDVKEIFSLLQEDGLLFVELKRALDRETTSTYFFNVSARDSGNPPLSSTTLVAVDVLDVNDNAPDFGIRHVSVHWDGFAPSAIFCLNATDDDVGDNGRVTYRIVASSPATSSFRIVDGIVFSTNDGCCVDCESCSVTVEAVDGGSPPLSTTLTLLVDVVRLNLHDPVINIKFHPNNIDFVVVGEHDEAGKTLAIVSLMDADAPLTEKAQLTLTDDFGVFRLLKGKNFHVLQLIDPQFATRSAYTIEFVCFDGQKPERSTKKQLMVYIEGLGRHSLVDVLEQQRVNVSDDAVLGSFVAQVKTNATGCTFVLKSEDAPFRIDKNNGIVFLAGNIERQFYRLDVDVRLPAPSLRTIAANVFVDVMKTNPAGLEHKDSLFLPSVPLHNSYLLFVDEDSTPGTIIGKLPTSNEHIFSTNSTGSALAVFPDGVVYVARPLLTPDNDEVISFVVVRRHRRVESKQKATVVVVVRRTNRNAPTCALAVFRISENEHPNTPVGVLEATDEDFGLNGVLSYELLDFKDTIRIDPVRGQVISLKKFDAESISNFTFHYSITDYGSPPRTTPCIATIVVEDVNDVPPKFLRPFFTTSMAAFAANTTVFTVEAVDFDRNEVNRKISYQLRSHRFLFEINSQRGDLRTKVDLRDDQTYNVSIRAVNSAPPYLFADTFVLIRTLPDFNQMPILLSDPMLKIFADDRPGVRVGTAKAFAGSAPVKWSIDDRRFSVDSWGNVVLADFKARLPEQIFDVYLSASAGKKKKQFKFAVKFEAAQRRPLDKVEDVVVKIHSFSEFHEGNRVLHERRLKVVDVGNSFALSEVLPSTDGFFVEGGAVWMKEHTFESKIKEFFLILSSGKLMRVLRVTSSEEEVESLRCDSTTQLVSEETAELVPSCLNEAAHELHFSVGEENAVAARVVNNRITVGGRKELITEIHVVAQNKAGGNQSAQFSITAIIDRPSDDVKFASSTVFMLLSSAHQPASSFGRVTADSILPVRYFVIGSSAVDIDPETGELILLRPFYHDVDLEVVAAVETGIAKCKVHVEVIEDRLQLRRTLFVFAPTRLVVGGVVGKLETLRDDVEIAVEDPFFSARNGEIYVRKNIDHDDLPYHFAGYAKKGKLASKFNVTVVIPKVVDESSDDADVYWIPENAPVNTVIGAVPRGSGRCRFEDDVGLKIDNEGIIRTKAVFDHEKVKIFSGAMLNEKGSVMTAKFFVDDENDEKPRFVDHARRTQIYENISVGAEIRRFSWTDSDFVNVFRLDVVDGDPFSHFSIGDDGVLRLSQPLDREKFAFHNLTIRVCDGVAPFAYYCDETKFDVEIIDVNDNSPTCEDMFVVVNADEVAEKPIGKVRSFDEDVDIENSIVFYRILPESLPGAEFLIDSSTGNIRINKGRNLTKSSYLMKIQVMDTGFSMLVGHCDVEIHVQRVRVKPPTFKPSDDVVYVNETAKRGTVVTRLHTFQMDDDVVHAFKLTADNDTPFIISPFDGSVVVDAPLDFERKSSYNITVTAFSIGFPNESATNRQLVINLIDENDEVPRFVAGDVTHLFVPEHSPLPHPMIIGSSVAEDLDDGQNGQLTYSILQGNTTIFGVNSTNGDVFCFQTLDREHTELHDIVVEVADGGQPRQKSTAKILIHVTDINDNTPKFVQRVFVANVSEAAEVGTEVVRLNATDADEGVNADISYSIGNNSDVPFEIDKKGGLIRLKSVLDRETQKSYTFTVMAMDGAGTRALNSTATVVVRVDDINDCEPVISNRLLDVLVPDDCQIGEIVDVVDVTDDDEAEEIRFELSGFDASYFSINRRGEISCAGALTAKLYFSVIAQITDSANHSTSASFTFYTKPGNMFPSWTEHVKTTSVSENEARRLAVFRATSPQTTHVVYSFVSPCRNHFFINTNSGILSSRASLDREEREKCLVWVVASDEQNPPMTRTTLLVVDILDVNDNPPIFSKPLYTMRVFENRMNELVGHVSASDADVGENAKLSYRIVEGNEAGRFGINDEGKLMAKEELDREQVSKYQLIVEAQNLEVPHHTSQAIVDVEVLDEDDNAPRFSRIFHVEIAEDAPIGTLAVHLTATDPDGSANHSFSIYDDIEGVPFQIDPTTGDVFVSALLDREKKSSYRIAAQLNDGLWSVQTNVLIVVTDVNDNPPNFANDRVLIFVGLDVKEDDVIGALHAADIDEGENGRVSYKIFPSNDFFRIDARSGVVKLLRNLSMPFEVFARDNGISPRTSTATVTVVSESHLKQTVRKSISVSKIPETIPLVSQFVSRDARVWPKESATLTDEGIIVKKATQVSVFDKRNSKFCIFDVRMTSLNSSRKAPEILIHTKNFTMSVFEKVGTTIGRLKFDADVDNIEFANSVQETPFFVSSDGKIRLVRPLTQIGEHLVEIALNDGVLPLINATTTISIRVVEAEDESSEIINFPVTFSNENICTLSKNSPGCVLHVERLPMFAIVQSPRRTNIRLFDMRPRNADFAQSPPREVKISKRALKNTILFATTDELVVLGTNQVGGNGDALVVKHRIDKDLTFEVFKKAKFSLAFVRSNITICVDERAPWPTFLNKTYEWDASTATSIDVSIHEFDFILPNDARMTLSPSEHFCVRGTTVKVCKKLSPGTHHLKLAIEADDVERTTATATVSVAHSKTPRLVPTMVFVRENSITGIARFTGYRNASFHIADDRLRSMFSITEQGVLGTTTPLNAESRSVYRVPITINLGRNQKTTEFVLIFVDDETDSKWLDNSDISIHVIKRRDEKFNLVVDSSPASLDTSQSFACVPLDRTDFSLSKTCRLEMSPLKEKKIVGGFESAEGEKKYEITVMEETLDVSKAKTAVVFNYFGQRAALAQFVHHFRLANEDMKINVLAVSELVTDANYEMVLTVIDRNFGDVAASETRRMLLSFLHRVRPSYMELNAVTSEFCSSIICSNGGRCVKELDLQKGNSFESRQNSSVFIVPIGSLLAKCQCNSSWEGATCDVPVVTSDSPSSKNSTESSSTVGAFEKDSGKDRNCVDNNETSQFCRCSGGFTADNCETAKTVYSVASGVIRLSPANFSNPDVQSCNETQSFEIDFRSSETSTRLLLFKYSQLDVSIEIRNGHVVYKLTDGKVTPVEMTLDSPVDDGEWHRLSLEMSNDGKKLRLQVDEHGKEAKSRLALPLPLASNLNYVEVGSSLGLCVRRILVQRHLVSPSTSEFAVSFESASVGCPVTSSAALQLITTKVLVAAAVVALCVVIAVAVIVWRCLATWRNSDKTCWEEAKEINAFSIKQSTPQTNFATGGPLPREKHPVTYDVPANIHRLGSPTLENLTVADIQLTIPRSESIRSPFESSTNERGHFNKGYL